MHLSTTGHHHPCHHHLKWRCALLGLALAQTIMISLIVLLEFLVFHYAGLFSPDDDDSPAEFPSRTGKLLIVVGAIPGLLCGLLGVHLFRKILAQEGSGWKWRVSVYAISCLCAILADPLILYACYGNFYDSFMYRRRDSSAGGSGSRRERVKELAGLLTLINLILLLLHVICTIMSTSYVCHILCNSTSRGEKSTNQSESNPKPGRSGDLESSYSENYPLVDKSINRFGRTGQRRQSDQPRAMNITK